MFRSCTLCTCCNVCTHLFSLTHSGSWNVFVNETWSMFVFLANTHPSSHHAYVSMICDHPCADHPCQNSVLCAIKNWCYDRLLQSNREQQPNSNKFVHAQRSSTGPANNSKEQKHMRTHAAPFSLTHRIENKKSTLKNFGWYSEVFHMNVRLRHLVHTTRIQTCRSYATRANC